MQKSPVKKYVDSIDDTEVIIRHEFWPEINKLYT
jgi:hypothetical protein